ncbi:TIGR00725 family protein [Candidatus Oleimmundimicrobium sp.]|uniref:TIGR00725 family protein n=1 Tax=Candidatus Oleimmundimicrobium sp. TaxID=3060597 RepID=UPI0027264859|nr:TIGR00725 family protein [Candidatus Oleimmundimicrobium sp.]MDO8886242.1 TIGR00725 family protein [Candidatus Oleimmundimicrobium sp.]
MYIGVIGSGQCDNKTAKIAYEIGRNIAKKGGILICGGLGGVMEAACKGAKDARGLSVGILPSKTRKHANPFIDIAIPTGMSEARNALVVRASDAVIAVGEEFGTLSEIGLALKMNKPVVGIGTWELSKEGKPIESIILVKGPFEAVEEVFRLVR